MPVRDRNSSSFIFLSGRDKTYSGQIRAHVLKRHLERRKENNLVPRQQENDRAGLSSSIDRVHRKLDEAASETPRQRISDAEIPCPSNTIHQPTLCRASLGNEHTLGANPCSLCSAIGCSSLPFPLLDHQQGPADFMVPKSSRTLFPHSTDRQAYLYHHCKRPLDSF